MTVAELIDTVLRRIAADFYAGRDQEFFRDQHALTRAIARYGVECQSRGWEFMPQVMQEDLLALKWQEARLIKKAEHHCIL